MGSIVATFIDSNERLTIMIERLKTSERTSFKQKQFYNPKLYSGIFGLLASR